jgi:hypothetical protein
MTPKTFFIEIFNVGEIRGSEDRKYKDGCLVCCCACSLIEVYRAFRGACCLCQQGDKAASASETCANFYKVTRRDNINDCHLQELSLKFLSIL